MSQTARTTPTAHDLTREGTPAVAETSFASLTEDLTSAATVVLDTSVLMADPQSYLAFGDADVVIPLTVIDELDRNKSRVDEAGRNARAVLRAIEEMRIGHGGDIATAVALPEAGTLRIEPNGLRVDELTAHHLDSATADHRIIAAALGLAHDGHRQVRLVSNDASLRIKASVLGVAAQAHLHPSTKRARTPGGWVEAHVSGELVNELYARGVVATDGLGEYDTAALSDLRVNQFVVLRSAQQSALARRTVDGLRLLAPGKEKVAWGLRAKSKEQRFALDLLTDTDVPLVALEGAAGTGKTMLAVAAGLQGTFEGKEPTYSRMTILRPVVAVGNQDLGFLPGDVEQKLGPWFETVVDTMVALSGSGQSHRECRAQLDLWVEQGRLTLESVTYLRGRSLHSTYVLVDEVQNLEVSTVKTIVSRLGQQSKGVLVGDTTQIDSPWTSEQSNGLTALISAFAGEPEFGHVTLTKGERSRVADMAADRL